MANVQGKTKNSVIPDEKINQLITQARSLVVTADLVASYHSHPYDQVFDNWADPSIGDVRAVRLNPSTIEVIFALAKNSEEDPNAALHLEYAGDTRYRFLDNKKLGAHDVPTAEWIDEDSCYIMGHYKEYNFQIRAYRWNNDSLEEIKLYSSEAALSRVLQEAGLVIEQMPKEALYYLRKLEYSLRIANKEKYKVETPYLVNKTKTICEVQNESKII